MNTKIVQLAESVKTSLWFIPSIMVLTTTALAKVLLALDEYNQSQENVSFNFLYQYSPDLLTALLTTIASSMMTVTSIAFSITIVALTLASSQFGPRLIRNFMMDKGTQRVLGVFVSTFIYCLLVLQSIRAIDGKAFIPGASAYIAVFLAFVSVAVLIFFIHHVARSIQADKVIDRVYCEVIESLERLFPSREQDDSSVLSQVEYPRKASLSSQDSGYLEAINMAELVIFAQENNFFIELNYKPGDFVVAGAETLLIHHTQDIEKEQIQQALNFMELGPQRTPVQDPEFAIHQLVEIAVRALSPSVNDPYSVITCIDKLTSVICVLTRKNFPPSKHIDAEDRLRVSTRKIEFKQISNVAFNQIRQHAKNNLSVTIRLVESLIAITQQITNKEHLEFVTEQAEMLQQMQQRHFLPDTDKADIDRRFAELSSHIASKQ